MSLGSIQYLYFPSKEFFFIDEVDYVPLNPSLLKLCTFLFSSRINGSPSLPALKRFCLVNYLTKKIVLYTKILT